MNERQKGYLILLLLALAMMLHYGESDRLARMAGNPAEAFCLNQNHTSDVRQNSAGVYGVCIVDGTEWEEWNYYRTQNPVPLANCTINTTITIWQLDNLTCGSIDGCGADYIELFATESQCRAVAGEAPLVEQEPTNETIDPDQPRIYWILDDDQNCVSVGPQVDPPAEQSYNSFSECTNAIDEATKYTSTINPNVIDKINQLQELQQSANLQRAAEEDDEPFWKLTKFWITLIILIIIAIIYGLWEKGPKKGFFQKGRRR